MYLITITTRYFVRSQRKDQKNKEFLNMEQQER